MRGWAVSNAIRLKVEGGFACFTRPELKAERFSYDVITPSAARGMIEAIHWKPAIRWQVDKIHVLRPIRFESIRRNEVKAKTPTGSVRRAMTSGDLSGLDIDISNIDHRNQRATTLLIDVAYLIEARVALTSAAGADDNQTKHLEIFSRRARKGQCFHQPCLGTREFAARFTLIEPGEPSPASIRESRDLGLMLWDIDHAAPGKPSLFFRAQLENGVVHVPPPGSVEIYR
jgi:CRISPR-associated protein Cas5d